MVAAYLRAAARKLPPVGSGGSSGLGGGGETPEQTQRLYEYVPGLAERAAAHPLRADRDRRRPGAHRRFYERFARLGELSHLRSSRGRPTTCASSSLGAGRDLVSGGNTANMLAIWRVHGFDALLREAWEAGVVLSAASAGMICWFEAGVTDSFGPQLEGMRDGLGFLAGQRLPALRRRGAAAAALPRLVDGGFPAGVAADDGVGLHFVGTELAEVVTCRPGAAAPTG